MSGSAKKTPRKKNAGSWYYNNNSLLGFSFLIAALIWVIVAMTVGREVEKNFTSVPVDINMQTDAFSDLGVNPVSVNVSVVTAKVQGDRVEVNRLTDEDLRATIKPSVAMTETGEYTLTLVPANSNLASGALAAIEYSPKEIKVRVDRLAGKTFKIQPVINGLSMPPDFVQGAETVSPSQISIRGPRAELDKIARCIIKAELKDPLEKTYVGDLPVILLDAQGEEINPDEKHLTLDYAESRLIIEMLKRTALELRVGFTNLPRSFPINSLRYTTELDYVEVAGPVDTVGRDTEILLGYIDVRTIDKFNNKFTFPLEVPEPYKNLEGYRELTVEFDSSQWEEAYFTASGITLLNVPDEFDVKANTETVVDIKFVGFADVIAGMTPEDIIMEVDLAERNISEGQIRLPIKISAPTRGLAWAAGEHYVILEITEAAQ